MLSKLHSYSYLILIAYLTIGYFYPALGVLAIICMLAPILTSPYNGRQWCGNYCPRGSFYDNIIRNLSPRKQIPTPFRSKTFRTVMLMIIMSVFGSQMYFAWGDLNAMGLVFLRIIFITTVIGVILAVIYHERTWCSFCPMGTMASWLSTKSKALIVSSSCKNCDLCQKICPMQLNPARDKANNGAFIHADCLKCNRCIAKCPIKALSCSYC